jgi:hypothetical protein
MPGQIVPGNPALEAARAAAFRQLSSIDPSLRGFLANQYDVTQIVVLPLPYWSEVDFHATRAAGPPVTFTFDTVPKKAFAYGIGDPMDVAGFPPATIAGKSNTNLLLRNQTRDNSDVWIWGLAAELTPDSDPVAAAAIFEAASVDISLNGTQTIPLGTLEMFPCAGGIFGAAPTAVRQPPTNVAGLPDGGQGALMSFVTNGYPAAGNFFRLAQPFKWAALGSAGADSSLSIITTLQAPVVITSALARAAVPIVPAVTPGTIEPFTPPAVSLDVKIKWHLICVSVGKRGVNT